MSVPFIQIGQCGNQVGSNFYKIMHDQGCKSSPAHQALLSQFFTTQTNQKDKAKAFLIDMQPKVVNRNLANHHNWQYDKQLSLVQQQGSGNNWAYGCNIHGQAIKQSLGQLFRKYAEGEDYIKCFVQIQSMAGGTGSGLGTFITSLLNDMFEHTTKYIICVMPHLSGQVILQSYNASLSLGTIYNEADGIFIIQNDDMNHICCKQLKITKPSLEDINEVIGRNIASVFFPVVNKKVNKIWSIQQNGFDYGGDMIDNLFMDCRYKLCSIKTAPYGPKNAESFNFDSWQAVENQLMFRKKYLSKSMMIIMRGNDHQKLIGKEFMVLEDCHQFYGYNRSMSLLDNGQIFVSSLQQILERGYNMFRNRAYLHQYEKYGMERQQMLDCFGVIENVLQSYKRL